MLTDEMRAVLTDQERYIHDSRVGSTNRSDAYAVSAYEDVATARLATKAAVEQRDHAIRAAETWRAYARRIEPHGRPCPDWERLMEADRLLALARGGGKG